MLGSGSSTAVERKTGDQESCGFVSLQMLGFFLKSFILYILYISCYVPFLDVDATAKDIKAFGLATQRGSFVTWDKRSGKTFHNLVSH